MLSRKSLPAAGRRSPTKPYGFVLRPRRSGQLRRTGERLASRHRRPAREKPAESPFPLRTGSPRFRIRSPAIAHYALRIFVDNRSLVGGGYHCGISLEIARYAVFLLNRHLFFTLFDFFVGNLQFNLIFGNVD